MFVKGNNLKNTDIKEISEKINEKKASALLRLHALTRRDFASKYNGKSNLFKNTHSQNKNWNIATNHSGVSL